MESLAAASRGSLRSEHRLRGDGQTALPGRTAHWWLSACSPSSSRRHLKPLCVSRGHSGTYGSQKMTSSAELAELQAPPLEIGANADDLRDTILGSSSLGPGHVIDINRENSGQAAPGQLGESARGLPGLPGLMVLAAGLPFVPGLDLQGPGSVLEAIGVLALIVTVHELGHFLAARSLGIHVTKFAIGFGPTILQYQANPAPPPETPPEVSKPKAAWLGWLSSKISSSRAAAKAEAPKAPGVEYSLRLIPLGGYVAFPDDDEKDNTYKQDDPDLLKNRPLLDRIIVVSAGVIANVVFAYAILFTQVTTTGLLAQQFEAGVSVPKVISGGAADKAGLRDGDVILAVEGKALPASEYSVSELVAQIKDRTNQPTELLVSRGGTTTSLTVRPTPAADGTGRINVQLSPNLETKPIHPRNILEASWLAFAESVRLGSLVVDGLRQLFLNFGEAAERLSGPVAIVAVGAEVARTNVAGLFQFAAIVNLNLAVVNILPLPALDGGFLLLLLVEGLRGGKKLPQDVERAIMSSGLLLLLTAGVFLIVRDTLGIFSSLVL